MRRVVVTGLGLLSPLGVGTQETWEGLLQGRSGVGPITRFDAAGFSVRIAAEVKGFDPSRWISPKDLKKADLFVHFGVAAADMALEASGLEITIERTHQTLVDRGPKRVSPFFIPGAIINMVAGVVSIRTGATGPNCAPCTACSTSAHAIGDAFLYIRHGYADAIIAGGAEAVISPMALAGFASMKALSTRNEEPERASRPWDKDRDGFVMGEGAGIVILEEFEHARRRGAPILAEVLGFGMSGDAYHISAPAEDGDGGVRVMRTALEDAGLNPEDVAYINAHGTATPHGDLVETRAVKRAFGSHAARLAMSSTKSMTGHLLGASGGLEFGITTLAVANDVIPPTVNLDEPEAENDLDYVPHTARELRVDAALTNSFGFGGTNACLAVGKLR